MDAPEKAGVPVDAHATASHNARIPPGMDRREDRYALRVAACNANGLAAHCTSAGGDDNLIRRLLPSL